MNRCLEKNRPRYFVILLTLLGWLFPINYAPANNLLSVNELIEIAIENNKDLQAAEYNVGRARARLVQAGQLPNPSLELSDIDDRAFTNEGEYTRSAGISQEFPVAGRIGRQKDVARSDVAIAQAEIDDAKRKLTSNVATAYYSLLINQRRLNQLDELLPINERMMRVAKQRWEAAEVSELDVNTAQLEYQRLLQDKKISTNQRTTLTAQLNNLLGRAPDSPLVLNQHLSSDQAFPSLAELQERALEERPDFHMALLTMDRAKADILLANAQRWADWRVGIGVEDNKLVVQGAPPQNTDRALSVNLSIPLPLLNQNKGRIQEAHYAKQQAYAQIEALELSIQTEVAMAYHQVNALQTVLTQSQHQALTLSAKNVQLAEKAYTAGQISLFEVVQLQRQQIDLQLTYLTTFEQYLQAAVKLQSAVGTTVMEK